MKRLVALSLFLLTFALQVSAHTAPSLGSNPLLRFVAEVRLLREFALSTIIEERCFRYMKKNERNSCYEAVAQKISVLDFDILMSRDKKTPVLLDQNNPGSFVFVAFKKDFIRLLSDQKTKNYLDIINSEMTKFLTGEKKDSPNLWELTLKFFGNELEATRALAVLFQDTSPVKLHLAYLEMSGAPGTSQWFDPNRELLGRTIDTLNMILEGHRESFQYLFYPKNIQARLHGTIYHFYVPTYLGLALKKKGVPDRFAFIAPLMMTLTYEFVTSAQDFRYILNDPANVTDHSLGDIYGCYNGVSFGLGRMSQMVSFQDLRKAFDVSVQSGVELLTK